MSDFEVFNIDRMIVNRSSHDDEKEMDMIMMLEEEMCPLLSVVCVFI